MDIQGITDQIWTMGVEYAPRVLMALITLVVGFWIIGKISNLITKALKAREVDVSLQTFLSSLLSILMKVALLIAVAGQLGIATTSFVAVLGAAGLAVGLALQGSLGNFAGGVLIMLFKPIKVGDLIEAQGFTGVVNAINIFVTTLNTPDNKRVIVPNGPLSNGPITNYSTIGVLRVDLVCGISYDADIKKAKSVVMEVMKNNPKVLQDPAPSVNVLELADSSVNLAIRPFATTANYWDVYFGIQEEVKIALDQAGVEIPFPQQVVHHMNAPQ